MADVFISYSRDDLETVSKIAAAVKDAGYDLWWDKDLPPHLSYTEVIQEKIGGAKAVIVVWSEDASKSEWVRAEADMARNQNKLVQTSIDDGMPPLPFNQIQYALLSDWDGESDHPAWQKVLLSLTDLVGKEHIAAPKPAPVRKKETPVPAPPPETAAAKNSQLPLLISICSLVLVAGLVGWLILGGDEKDSETTIDTVASAEAEEPDATDPAATSDTDASEPALPAVPLPKSPKSNEFNESAMIEDADGWTNFRAEPTRSSSIVGRIETGEVFYTHRQQGQWWKIRTDDGQIGYMHYSRIALTASRAKSATVYFPDSGSRIIGPGELSSLSKAELRLARNEIFARKGRIFQSADLTEHFSRFDWYRPTSTEVAVNDTEKANARTIQAEEQRR
ncbi:MAG: TIR domain-containing protein [Parasphingorhabdus sp.]